jgi:hypothetical protein
MNLPDTSCPVLRSCMLSLASADAVAMIAATNITFAGPPVCSDNMSDSNNETTSTVANVIPLIGLLEEPTMLCIQ